MSMAEWEKKERERQAEAARNIAKLRDVLTHYGVSKVFITYDGGNDECGAQMALAENYDEAMQLERQILEEMGLPVTYEEGRRYDTDPFQQLGWELGKDRAHEVEYSHSGSGHFWADLATGREIPDTHHGSRTYEEGF